MTMEYKKLIFTEFLIERDIDLGFCHWKKQEFYPLGISERLPSRFNYFSIHPNKYRNYINPDFFFKKRKYNSYIVQLPNLVNDELSYIDELKLTNLNISEWMDIWEDFEGDFFDPKIKKINLSHNNLLEFSILDYRKYLNEVNVSFNQKLVYLNISNSPNLKKLDLSHCASLEYINVSSSRELNWISLKRCNCSEECLESLLRNINTKRQGYLDISGNTINWANRNIASKIRLLLANNWNIKWDFDPPDSIVPLGYWKKFDPLLLDRNFK